MQNYFLTPQYKRVERVRRAAPDLEEKEKNRLKAIEVWQKTRDTDFVQTQKYLRLSHMYWTSTRPSQIRQKSLQYWA